MFAKNQEDSNNVCCALKTAKEEQKPDKEAVCNETQPTPQTTGLEQQGPISDGDNPLSGDSYGLECINDFGAYDAHEAFINRIPIAYAREKGVLALSSDDDVIPVACSEVGQISLLDDIALVLGAPVRMVLAPREQIIKAINKAYEGRATVVQDVVEQINPEEVAEELDRLTVGDDLLDIASRAPVIKLVNTILFQALKDRSSDVHFQPYDESLVIRFRIDGTLYDRLTIPSHLQEAICSRLKVMGKMNIAERRLAQDGRASVQIGEKIIDLRISSLPTSYGERIVVRLLDKSKQLQSLSDLGMSEETLVKFEKVLKMGHGIVLVTGPTGSGKTTTLYGSLRALNNGQENILTLEDPIEYQLAGISQTQISEKKGMTFASGLRHVLRQDPDIIMVGEIRDQATAKMAIQSSLTGHLVFSTLHTNDSLSAIARMLDLDIEPYLVASSVIAVLAQRLIRKTCPACREPYHVDWTKLDEALVQSSGGKDRKFYRGRGCDKCQGTGYVGRTGIFELLELTPAIRSHIHNNSQIDRIRETALQEGLKTLRMDGYRKVVEGITDVPEILRVTQSHYGK